jgi:hypothetical protein
MVTGDGSGSVEVEVEVENVSAVACEGGTPPLPHRGHSDPCPGKTLRDCPGQLCAPWNLLTSNPFAQRLIINVTWVFVFISLDQR